MPFGSFWIQKKENKKKEKKKKEKFLQKKNIEENEAKEQSVNDRETFMEPKTKTSFFKEPAPKISLTTGTVGSRISILLVGHSQRTICNFLCSMNINMNDLSGEAGLAFYTEDHKTMSRMIATKKKLDGIFYNRQRILDEMEEKDLEGTQTYSFRVSLAGRQSRCVEFIFTCITEEESPQIAAYDFDILWILEEEPYLEQGRQLYEGIHQYSQIEGQSQIPILFLMSQFEYLEHFRVREKEITLSYDTKEKLIRQVRTLWENSLGSSSTSFQILPIQIYGGLEFCGWNPSGREELEISKSGFYQRYIPVGCQMPLSYTVDACIDSNHQDFFLSADGNMLMNRLSQAFYPYRKSEALSAEQIGGLNSEEKI